MGIASPLPWIAHTADLLRLRFAARRARTGGSIHGGHVAEAEVRALLEGEPAEPEGQDEARAGAEASWAAAYASNARAAADGTPATRLHVLGAVLDLDEDAARALSVLVALSRAPVLEQIALSLSGDPVVQGITPLFLAELVAAGDPARAVALLGQLLPGGALARLRLVRGAAGRPLRPRGLVEIDARLAAWLAGEPAAQLWTRPDQGGELAVTPPPRAEVFAEDAAFERVRAGLTLAAQRRPRAFRLAVVGQDARLVRDVVHVEVAASGQPLLVIRRGEHEDGAIFARRLVEACRDALVHRAVLFVAEVERLTSGDDPWWPAFAETLRAHAGGCVLAASGACHALSGVLPDLALVSLPLASSGLGSGPQVDAMTRALGGGEGMREVAADVVPGFLLTGPLVGSAAAEALARAQGEPVTRAVLAASIRSQLESRIGDFAAPVSEHQGLDDLELPDDSRRALLELMAAWRLRQRVLETWGFGARIPNAKGISALFFGPPGTGKTLAAGIVAREIGSDLYKIELSRVVDKYIGETEKHLARVFDEAARGHLVLLFDEADSLFAKRTKVGGATDRYANLGVNFLLQRIERHEGVVILTTNHEALIDQAFKRRLRFRISFPVPGVEERVKIWQRLIPADAPLAPAVDFPLLGRSYEMSGGHIRNAALRAAYLAADGGHPLDTATFVRAANAEYRAMGKLVRDETD